MPAIVWTWPKDFYAGVGGILCGDPADIEWEIFTLDLSSSPYTEVPWSDFVQLYGFLVVNDYVSVRGPTSGPLLHLVATHEPISGVPIVMRVKAKKGGVQIGAALDLWLTGNFGV